MTYVQPTVIGIKEKDPFKKVELAGRTCYKSEDKITETSAKKFVAGLIKSNHTAMLEHCTFVFEIKGICAERFAERIQTESPFLHVTRVFADNRFRTLVSGNARALNGGGYCTTALLIELEKSYPEFVWDQDIQSITPEEFGVSVKLVDLEDCRDLKKEELLKHCYRTFRFITNRGVTHELVRHRLCSFAQESTRYVNYKDGIMICPPATLAEKPDEVKAEYEEAFWDAEKHYQKLIEAGEKPQEARAVLPIGLKTEIVVTANIEEWKWILELRYLGTTGAPHPDIKQVMRDVYAQLLEEEMIRTHFPNAPKPE